MLLPIPILLGIWERCNKTFHVHDDSNKQRLRHDSGIGIIRSVSSNIGGTVILDRLIPPKRVMLFPGRSKVVPTNVTKFESSGDGSVTLRENWPTRFVQKCLPSPSKSPKYSTKYLCVPRFARILKVMNDGSIWYVSGGAIWKEDWNGERMKKI